MGIFRDVVAKGIDFVREEVLPLQSDLIKAGILTPDKSAFEPKANLTDPTNYGAMNYGYKEKWALLDYSKCRQISYSDPIIAAIIQVRINQIAAFSQPQTDKHKLGFKIKLRDNEKKPSSADKKRMKELSEFVSNTGVPENFEDTPKIKKRDNFEQFLRKISRDTLTFDQLNFEVTPRRNGQPYSFSAVDAATIRMVPDEKEKREYFQGAGNYGPEDFANIMPNHNPSSGRRDDGINEFMPKHPKYVQVVNGVLRHIFDEWEMCFGVRNPRTDVLSNGYGFSEIEMLVATITSHMNAEAYNRRFFSQGSTIKGILTFEGSVPSDQLEAFRRQWYMQSVGITNAWKTPIMSVGEKTKLNWVDLHKSNKEMEYGKWLEYCIKSICGVYQIDPLEIGFDITKQGSGEKSSGSGGIGDEDHSGRVLYSQEKGLRPLLRHIQQCLNEYVIYRIDPNYELEFVGLNVGSEKDELDQAIAEVKAFKTVNEIRAEHDLEPITEELGAIKNPADMILDASWITAWSQASQAAQMAEQGGEMGMPGMEGAPGEEGAPPEGEAEPNIPTDEELENMSIEELEAELAKLEGGDEEGGEELKSPQPTKKSLEIEL